MTHIFSSGTLLVVTCYFLRKCTSCKEDSRGTAVQMASMSRTAPTCPGCTPRALGHLPHLLQVGEEEAALRGVLLLLLLQVRYMLPNRSLCFLLGTFMLHIPPVLKSNKIWNQVMYKCERRGVGKNPPPQKMNELLKPH